MLRVKGILWAALSSSTFGLAPLFTLLLLGVGYSSFEVLTYRWGVASLCLGAYGLLAGCDFRLGRRELGTVFLLSLFVLIAAVGRRSPPLVQVQTAVEKRKLSRRTVATSLSLVIAYQNIASGVASTIHFMYPLVVAVVMMCFFRERGSVWTFAAIGMSIVGAVLLSLGNVDFSHGDTTLGIVSATVSVVAYGGYIVGVRRSRAVEIDSTVLTCCVMAFGALFFIAGGLLTGGVRLETDPHTWLYILGVAIPATAVSNMALVQAIKSIGPTLTSIFGAMEPLTAVVIGVWVFAEPFTAKGAAGILLIVAAVSVVVLRSRKG